jgi:hypothetical protein
VDIREKEDHSADEHQNSDEDDDRSNNGEFEFPTSSRRRYEARYSDCDSQDLSSFMEEANVLDETQPEAPVTLKLISMMHPKPVSKRSGSSGIDSAKDETERTEVAQALDQVSLNASNSQSKDRPFRFSWTNSRTEPNTRCIDESERTSATLNEAALPSRRSATAKRPSWKIWSSSETRHSFKEADQDENLPEAQSSESSNNALEVPDANINNRVEVLIDPTLFDEIRGTKPNDEVGDQIDFGEAVEEDDESIIYGEYVQMMLRSSIQNQEDYLEPMSNSMQIPTFNEHTERNRGRATDDASACTCGTDESDAAVVGSGH